MAASALALLLPASARAQANWITSVPPERLLQWQPRTAEEFAHPPRLFAPPTALNSRARAAPLAAAAYGDPQWQEWGPPERAAHTLALDTRRQRLILLGGYWQMDPRGSVWGFDLPAGEWSEISVVPGAPQPREILAAVYDSLRDRLLVLQNSGHYELEVLDLGIGHSWTHLWTGPTTSAFGLAGMAIDTRRDAVTLLGVWDEAAAAHRVVRVPLTDPAAWTTELTQGTQPDIPGVGLTVSRGAGAAVYDESRDAFHVLFVPSYEGGGEAKIYSLNAGGAPTWAAVPAPQTPYDLRFQVGLTRGLAMDAALDRVLLVGDSGTSLALSLSGGTPQWLAPAASSTIRRVFAAAMFDPASRNLFLDGGSSMTPLSLAASVSPTLISATVDSGVPATTGPPPAGLASWLAVGDRGLGDRSMHSTLLDPIGQQLVIFGGYSWTDDPRVVMARPLERAGRWSVLGAGSDSIPRGRFGGSIVFDPLRHALLWYGGQATDGTGDLLADLWTLPLSPRGTWQRLVPPGPTPGARRYAAFIFDAARSRFLLLGGDDLREPLIDAWELRLAATPAWRALSVTGPAPAYQALFADDARGDAWSATWFPDSSRHVTLGDDEVHYDVVALPESAPPMAHYLATLAGFDPTERRLLWFVDPTHGYSTPFTQMWSTLLGGPTAQWVLNDVAGPGPTPRGLMATVFDPATSTLMLTGGVADNGCYFGDTWALPVPSSLPTAVRMSILEATSDASGVTLRWELDLQPGTPCTVERSSDGVSWSQAGVATWTGAHEIRFVDAPLASGARLAYRLRIAAQGAEQVESAIWLDAPNGGALAIAPLASPCRGAPTLRLAMAARTPARVRVLDVAGRVVSVAVVPAGTREWTASQVARPGLYFAELAQGGERRVARVVVAP